MYIISAHHNNTKRRTGLTAQMPYEMRMSCMERIKFRDNA